MNRFSRLNARTMILCVLVMSSFIISSLHVNGQNRSYEAWVDYYQIDNSSILVAFECDELNGADFTAKFRFNDNTLLLKCDDPDNNSNFVYQEFSRN